MVAENKQNKTNQILRKVKVLLLKLLLTFLIVFLFFAFHAEAGFHAVTDTEPLYVLDEELFTDILDIGPEFTVTVDVILIDEDAIPSFSEVLDQFVIPFPGKVISKYGMRKGRMHTGTDIKLQLGDTVVAAYQGIVTRATSYYGYGKLVVINHFHGLETYYSHLSNILVNAGDTVYTGQVIGLGGRTGRATGTHLHFEIRENGRAYNPELVYDFDAGRIRPEIYGKEMLAQLAQKPKVTPKNNVIDMKDAPSEYVVKSGDSLWLIARRFQVTVNELCELNNLTNQSILKIGAVLRIF